MPIDSEFREVANAIRDPGMGTENVADLLYALIRVHRPRVVLAAGLGYSTLSILRALADNEIETRADAAVAAAPGLDPARASVLSSHYDHAGYACHCFGVDDFDEQPTREERFVSCVQRLGLTRLLTVEVSKVEAALPGKSMRFDFAWIDCGHQIDYAGIVNAVWPRLEVDGGLLAIHSSYVPFEVAPGGGEVITSGPVANEMKRQLLISGLDARFELLSLIEPHKRRQSSVTLLRRVDEGDTCRDLGLQATQRSWYGIPGDALCDLNATS
jgi:predicted O-methyltransferase YrrM